MWDEKGRKGDGIEYLVKEPELKEKQHLYACALKGHGKEDSLDVKCHREERYNIAVIHSGTRRKVKRCLTQPGLRVCV